MELFLCKPLLKVELLYNEKYDYNYYFSNKETDEIYFTIISPFVITLLSNRGSLIIQIGLI